MELKSNLELGQINFRTCDLVDEILVNMICEIFIQTHTLSFSFTLLFEAGWGVGMNYKSQHKIPQGGFTIPCEAQDKRGWPFDHNSAQDREIRFSRN